MAQVYGWMACGLLLTAFVARYSSNSMAIMSFVFSSKITFFGLIICSAGTGLELSPAVERLSASMATRLFMLYSARQG